MSSWETLTVADVAELIDYGVTASSTWIAHGPKFLRITDIQAGQVNWSSVPWCECAGTKATRSRLQPGDLVFARTGATTGKSFLIRECPNDAVFASYLIRVRVRESVDPVYVSHFFQSPDYWAQIARSARGAAQPGVNASLLRAIEIPIPPLPEQQRIAEALDRAEALRAKRREALAQLDCSIQSTFVNFFGDPAKNPRRWPEKRIGDLLESASYGTSEKSGLEGEFPVLRMNNLTSTGELDLRDLKYMNLPVNCRERYLVRVGDVLFNRTNSPELVGKTAVVRHSNPLAYAGYLIRLRVNSQNHGEYVAAFLNTAYAKRTLRGMCKSIIGMANINAAELKAMKALQPPLNVQQEFARCVEAIERMKVAQRESLAQLDALFASLQHRAFRGEL